MSYPLTIDKWTRADYDRVWAERKAAGLVTETTEADGRRSRQSWNSTQSRDEFMSRAKRNNCSVVIVTN